jgi:N,N'-diacetyllegionaminate synthase
MKSKSTLIIAEAGVNHNGSMELAYKLIDAAADAGADLVKFQTFDARKLVTESADKAKYQKQTTDAGESQYDMLSKLELSKDMHEDLISYCAQRGVGFFSTGFDNDSLDMLIELGLGLIKIPSGEITNLFLLRHAGSLGKPIILSTGMSNLGEIEDAINVLTGAGVPREKICVLHCNTEYPTPMEDVNLQAMLGIKQALQVDIGYSDHTQGITIPIAAVALGATVIEKHLTLDRGLPGPDHLASLEPEEFSKMVKAIRDVECALGDGVKRPSASESKNKQVSRKSLVASREIAKGEMYSEENVCAKRPGTGISPMRWNDLNERISSRNFKKDELLEL